MMRWSWSARSISAKVRSSRARARSIPAMSAPSAPAIGRTCIWANELFISTCVLQYDVKGGLQGAALDLRRRQEWHDHPPARRNVDFVQYAIIGVARLAR